MKTIKIIFLIVILILVYLLPFQKAIPQNKIKTKDNAIISQEIIDNLESRGYKINGIINSIVKPSIKDTIKNTSTNNEFINLAVSIKIPEAKQLAIQPKSLHTSFNNHNSAYDTLMIENFETGVIDTNKWKLSGEPTWGITDYRTHNHYSVWCAGSDSLLEPKNGYPKNLNSMMVFGPFDLSDVNYAKLSFWYWLDTEIEKDWFFYMASTDGENFNGIGTSGANGFYEKGKWEKIDFHLSHIPKIGDITGRSQIWIAFSFQSDSISTSDWGVFLDDIILAKKQIDGTLVIDYVSGHWDISGSPYVAIDNIGVDENDSLIIDPGVEVRFEQEYGLYNWGKLTVVGTKSDTIIFTTNKPIQAIGDWEGIWFKGKGILDYCRIEYGTIGVYIGYPLVFLSNSLIWRNSLGIRLESQANIRNCQIVNNKGNGISAELSNGVIEENIISYNDEGIYGIFVDFLIKNNEISYNSKEGITCGYSAEPFIIGNNIHHNGKNGIQGMNSPDWPSSTLLHIVDNDIHENDENGIYFYLNCNKNYISNNLIYKNKKSGIDASNIVFGPELIIQNNTIDGNNEYGVFFDYRPVYDSKLISNIISNNGKAGLQYEGFSGSIKAMYNAFHNNNPNIDKKAADNIGTISNVNYNSDPCDPFFNIFLNPQYTEVSLNDYTLSPASPCINGGDPNFFLNDKNGSLNDIGAYGGNYVYTDLKDYDFGIVKIDHEEEKTFEFINYRDSGYMITSFAFNNIFPYSTSVEDTLLIDPYQKKEIDISFKPSEIISYSDTLNILSNDFTNGNSHNLVFKGEGINGTILTAYSETIRYNGKFTLEGSPYIVKKPLIIEEGDSLIIEPGVKVLFDKFGLYRHGHLQVKGYLKAQGTEKDSIIFTKYNDDSRWNGIGFSRTDSSSIMRYCRVEYSERSGIYIDESDILIENCLIQNNGLDDPNDYPNGAGGIVCNGSNAIIKNNVIRNNYKSGVTNWMGPDYAGGISISRVSTNRVVCPIILHNIIYGNYCGRSGGGIGLYDSAYVANNIVYNNYSKYGGGLEANSNDRSPIIINNVIYRNTAEVFGGGLRLVAKNISYNNTIVSNQIISPNESGSGVYSSSPIKNSIVYNNMGGDGSQVKTFSLISYSCIQGGFEGEGNIDADPLFVDPENGNFLLQTTSPCIDAGNPSPQFNDPEDPNNPGFALFPAQGTVRNDMGAFGGPNTSSGLITSVEETLTTASPTIFELMQNYPNPFNPETTIKYQIPKEAEIKLKIYNILGQEIVTLVNEKQLPGSYSIKWDGKDRSGRKVSSGLYLYQLQTKDFVKVKKLVLVR